MENAPAPRRSTIARVGIVLLNLWQPGLGLIRLGRYRSGLACLAACELALLGMVAFYMRPEALGYTGFIVMAALVIAILVGVTLCAVILTWRNSAVLTPRGGWLWRWYVVLGLGLVLGEASAHEVNFARTCYRNFSTQSASTAPTLEPGDMLLAKMRDFGPLRRGDLVLIRVGDWDFIKRIAGLPGDRVALRDGIVLIDGQPVSQHLLGESMSPQHARRLSEQFPGELRSHEILDMGVTPQDNVAPVKLGAGQYFVLGDNRDNSADSRLEPEQGGMGLVPADRIEGRTLFRFWRRGVGLAEGKL